MADEDGREELDRINKIDRIGDGGERDELDRINKIDRIGDGDVMNDLGGTNERGRKDAMDGADDVTAELPGLSLGDLVGGRVGEFSEGLVMGSQAFVEEVFQANRTFFGAKRKEGARRLLLSLDPFFVAKRSRSEDPSSG
jgi:hypothetical protein